MKREQWRKPTEDEIAHRRAGGRRGYNARRSAEVARRRRFVKKELQHARSIGDLIYIGTLPADARLPKGLVDYLVRVTKTSKTTIKSDIKAIRDKNSLR